MDVVPEGTGWEHEPYKCVLENGFLVGRGVADNKGAGMAALYALRFISEHGIKLEHPIEIYYGTAEETGMEDIEIYLQHVSVHIRLDIIPERVVHGDGDGISGLLRYLYPEVSGDFDARECVQLAAVLGDLRMQRGSLDRHGQQRQKQS